ncbi:MAG: phage tail tape measure protein [Methylocystis sp.]
MIAGRISRCAGNSPWRPEGIDTMATLETRLIASLTDRISGPARKASESLKGLSKDANIKLGGGGVFNSLHREIGVVNRQLDQMRGRMVDSVAQLYILKNALTAPIKAAATFEDRLVDIGQKAGKTREEMKRVGEDIARIAKSTTRSQQEVADTMDNVVGRGLNFDTAFKVLPSIGRAATTYKAEIDDMASTSMALLDNFKVKAEQLPEVIDRLSQASKAGAFELKNMAKEFPQLLAIGQMRGMTGVIGATQIATALQVVQKGAGTPEQAATNLRNVLQKMDFEETRNKFGKAAMARDALARRTSLANAPDFVKRALATNFAGMKSKDVKAVENVYKAQWLKGELLKRAQLGESPIEAIRSVTRDVIGADKLDAMVARMQKAGKSADDIAKALIEAKINGISVSDLFADSEAQAGIASLVANVKLYNDILADVNKNSKGTVDRDLKDRAQTTGDAFRRLMNAIDGLNAAIGGALTPVLTPLSEMLEGIAERLKVLTTEHPILVRNVTIATAAFVGLRTALIGARWAFLGLRAAGLAFIATPLGASLTAIGAAVLLIWTNWDKLKELFPNVTKRFEETVTSIKDTLLNTDWMQVGRDMISSLWAGMKEWLNKILAGVGDFIGKVRGLFVGSASASTGGSATSMGGDTGGSGGGGGYTAAAERMRRLSGGGASGATPGASSGLGSSPRGSGASTPSSRAGGATPSVAGAATGGSGLLDRIARAEGTAGRGDYNTVLGYGRYGLPNKPLTEMTLAEAFAFGRKVKAKHGRSSVLGRYQIVGNTMKIAMARLGLKWSDKFSSANQDAIARVIYRMQGRRLGRLQAPCAPRARRASPRRAVIRGRRTGLGNLSAEQIRPDRQSEATCG